MNNALFVLCILATMILSENRNQWFTLHDLKCYSIWKIVHRFFHSNAFLPN